MNRNLIIIITVIVVLVLLAFCCVLSCIAGIVGCSGLRPITSTATHTLAPAATTPTETSRPTHTPTRTTTPKPKLSKLALTFEDINRILPGFYSPPRDVTKDFPSGGALEYYVCQFDGTNSDLLVALYRYKDSNESSLYFQLERDHIQKLAEKIEDLPSNILSGHGWLATTSGGRMLVFYQAEVEVIITARFSPDHEVEGMSGIIIILGGLQQTRLESGGYR